MSYKLALKKSREGLSLYNVNFRVQAVTSVTSGKPLVTSVSTRVREHLTTDRTSHVYKHLQESENCRNFVFGRLLIVF